VTLTFDFLQCIEFVVVLNISNSTIFEFLIINAFWEKTVPTSKNLTVFLFMQIGKSKNQKFA